MKTHSDRIKSKFGRDASKRLTYEIYPLESGDYAKIRQQLIKKFALKSIDEAVVGFDEIFQDFYHGDVVIGIEWDIWSGFVVVAKNPEAEELVKKIGCSLESQYLSKF